MTAACSSMATARLPLNSRSRARSKIDYGAKVAFTAVGSGKFAREQRSFSGFRPAITRSSVFGRGCVSGIPGMGRGNFHHLGFAAERVVHPLAGSTGRQDSEREIRARRHADATEKIGEPLLRHSRQMMAL